MTKAQQLPLELTDVGGVEIQDDGKRVKGARLKDTSEGRDAVNKLQQAQYEVGDTLFERYVYFRRKGFEYGPAVVGAWLSVGNGPRGKLSSQLKLANALGVTRYTVWRWQTEVQDVALGMRAMWWAENVPALDAATLEAATRFDGTAADRKLAYQVAAAAGLKALSMEKGGDEVEGMNPFEALARARGNG